MAETMEQYISKTQADYGSGIVKPKIDDKYHFELKGQFLKELRDNTFSDSDHEDANKHIEKVLQIFDLFHVVNITQDQIMLRVFPMSLTGADPTTPKTVQSKKNVKPLKKLIILSLVHPSNKEGNIEQQLWDSTIEILHILHELSPIYDTDNEEEESMPVYDTDIEDVIKEEEGFVGKGGFGGKEDNIEDIVVVTNDLSSSMIQTILSVDFEEDINTKSHELMFMNYFEEQTDKKAMINCINNGDQPLPRVTQVSIAGTSSTEQPHLKDKSMWSDQEKKIQKIDHLKKTVVVTSDPLALIAEKTKITTLLAKAFNRRNFYSKPTNNNLRTSSTSQSANQKQEFVKSNDKKVKKKDDEKKRDMSKVKCYNCNKEGHFAKDCKKVKVKYYEYYMTKMLLAKKDKYEQVLLAKDQSWMESSSDSNQKKNANMVFIAQIKKFFQIQSEYEYETSEYYDNTTTYGLFMIDNDDQEIFHDCESQIDHNESAVDHNDSEGIDKLIRKFNKKIVKCLKRIEKANQQNKDFENQNKDLQDNYDVLKNQATTFEMKNKELNEQLKVLIEKNNDLLAQTNVLKDQLQIYLWIIDSECSKHMTGNHALLTNFVEKFLGTVHFGNNDFAVIAGYGDVGLEVAFRKSTCFVRTKDGVDLLTGDRSSNLYTIAFNKVASNTLTCLLAKASSLQSWLWHQRLSHLNFATINNLVKNNFVQGLPKMKFKKDHLGSACEQEKIHRKHHKSKTAFASNKPLYLLHMDCADQLERRNRTLVEAARTMLTFANLPLFLWDEAIATACFTKNRSIIHKRFVKTPYELMNKRKPNIKFFCVFGCRCYLLNDYEDVGKLKAKGDIGVFVGYSKESAAFRIYNKRTRKIYESVNVNFDEISEMASKQFSLEPAVSQALETSNKDLEDLSHNFYDEYFDASKIMKSSTMNVETSNIEIPSHEEEVFHESSESFQEESSSSSLNDNVQQSSKEVRVPSSNTQSVSNNMVPNVDEASTSHNVFNERLEDAYFDASTSSHDPSNVHTFYQPYPYKKKWTKDHSLYKIVGDSKLSVRTRGQIANSCLFSCLLSSIELANVAEALRDADWVSAMQE
nr:hypothetical protein [Tanacetum cinerariifolium]